MVDLICDILLSYYHDFNIVMYPDWNNNVLFNMKHQMLLKHQIVTGAVL